MPGSPVITASSAPPASAVQDWAATSKLSVVSAFPGRASIARQALSASRGTRVWLRSIQPSTDFHRLHGFSLSPPRRISAPSPSLHPNEFF